VPLTRLAAVVEALAAGEPLAPDDGRWLGRALETYMAADTDLAASLNLPWRWRQALRHDRRDRLILALAATFEGTVNARAVATSGALRRYGSTGWPHERHLTKPPPPFTPERRLLFSIYRLDPDPPTGIRWLSEIIDAEVCSSRDLITARGSGDSEPTANIGASI
jgi:hypothetical protein